MSPAPSEQARHADDGREPDAWQDDTAPAMRLVAVWKRGVVRAQAQLVGWGCAVALLDVVAAWSACVVPLLSPVLSIARMAGLAVLVPAILRALAMQHADREDAELVKAIAVAVGVAALYIVVRTRIVVGLCAL